MILLPHERERFIQWLRQEIASDKPLIEQAEKMRIPEPVVRRMKTAMAACAVVADILEKIESQEISSE